MNDAYFALSTLHDNRIGIVAMIALLKTKTVFVLFFLGLWLVFFVGPTFSQATLTDTVEIEVLRLCSNVDDVPEVGCRGRNAGQPVPSRDLCSAGDTSYGCSAGGYPFGNENPVTLNMETYVKSVIANETSPGADPFEFLKAHTIASRMYAHAQTSGGTVVINNSTEKQAYIPNVEHSRSNQAVQETQGILLIYQADIINALYSSDHGKSDNPDLTVDGGQPWADENNFMSSNVTDPVFVLLAGQKQRPLDVEIGQIFRGFCDTNLT